MPKINIAALDGSLKNFGVVKLTYDTDTGALEPYAMHIFKTVPTKHKQVRKGSDYYARARSIAVGVRDVLDDTALLFAEVPSGGQDYPSVMGFGITIGIYAGLQRDITEVSPGEAKKAAVGTRTASKQEMIAWATELYPNAPWASYRGKFTLDNEHLADAVAIAHAGIKTPQFQQVLAMLAAAKTFA